MNDEINEDEREKAERVERDYKNKKINLIQDFDFVGLYRAVVNIISASDQL